MLRLALVDGRWWGFHKAMQLGRHCVIGAFNPVQTKHRGVGCMFMLLLDLRFTWPVVGGVIAC